VDLHTSHVFEEELDWWAPGAVADQMWNNLIENQKEGAIYVSATDSEMFNLEAGLDSGNPDIYKYPVSMYHQLHCLVRIFMVVKVRILNLF
jgi:hypothetical protein